MITTKSPDQLAREDLIRQTLDSAAQFLETRNTNRLYKAAWKSAAKLLRANQRDIEAKLLGAE
jgi:hypothetical protein